MSSWRSSTTTERLAVARVLGAKGLAGAVRIEPLSDRPDRLQAGAELYLDGETQTRSIESIEPGGRRPVLRLAGIETREAAEALRGRYLEVEPGDLPAETYYWHQIIGLRAMDPDGKQLGTVVDVFRAGENEVYAIDRADGGELLVPALRTVVRSIDLPSGSIVIDYRPEEVR